ncbi:ribonuclease G [Acetitomaculum ruminis DSM 5522]|uniref:Ribonuclease G n=1 Tax=Acetitomaculum ruminis DSM 5522 TaxID=1120918 RepID=A0A1I0VGQ0_9FIRM|nr:ribonuclease E/G [Acetitomaculum ruminis]SFA75545.1 ribonuclease G [Acetitomaculum ruminis DSM 5522]
METKLVITNLKYNDNNKCVSAYFENDEIIELNTIEDNLINSVYIGKVENIVPSINAAFINIGIGEDCYFSLKDNQSIPYVNEKKDNKLKIGDEILVQVSKEAGKKKPAVVTSNIAFTGKYVVITYGNTKIGISKKLSKNYHERFENLGGKFANDLYGIVFRTNSVNARDEDIFSEIRELEGRLNKLLNNYKHRSCYSKLISGITEYEQFILRCDTSQMDFSVVTDNVDIYENLKNNNPNYNLRLYEDDYPLFKLYNLESSLKKALSKKVWLKSGAFLYIEHTEAMTVIDVNSGKYSTKKKEEAYLKINIEAAKEVARQLRLRNISGICIVDFIDMEREEDQNELMKQLRSFIKKDPVGATLVDITKLNLVEITRKRIKKPLYEQFASISSIQEQSFDDIEK